MAPSVAGDPGWDRCASVTEVKSIVFSPDGKKLAAGGDGTILVWDMSFLP
jgi:WD40 repeat protein